MTNAWFEIYPSGKRFRVRLRAPNGEIIALSRKTHRTVYGCRDTILAIQREASIAYIRSVKE